MAKKFILFVDDDVDHTFGIEQRLKMDGFEVERATTAKQAWDKLQSGQYYGVILDIMMPSGGLFPYNETDQDLKTGILLCKMIKDNYNNKLRIIGLTNHHDETIKKDFKSSGGDICLEKLQNGVAGIISKILSK